MFWTRHRCHDYELSAMALTYLSLHCNGPVSSQSWVREGLRRLYPAPLQN